MFIAWKVRLLYLFPRAATKIYHKVGDLNKSVLSQLWRPEVRATVGRLLWRPGGEMCCVSHLALGGCWQSWHSLAVAVFQSLLPSLRGLFLCVYVSQIALFYLFQGDQ